MNNLTTYTVCHECAMVAAYREGDPRHEKIFEDWHEDHPGLWVIDPEMTDADECYICEARIFEGHAMAKVQLG